MASVRNVALFKKTLEKTVWEGQAMRIVLGHGYLIPFSVIVKLKTINVCEGGQAFTSTCFLLTQLP